MRAKKRVVEKAVFTSRGSGGTVPLNEYGRPGTFGLAVAEKLAATGLNEAEYVIIAQKFGTNEKRFKAYIRYFIQEGFNIVLENGRYVQKEESSYLTGSLSPTQAPSKSEIPTKVDFESAYKALTCPGETISIDSVLDQIEINAKKKGHLFNNNWRMITEENIMIWSKK